MGLIEKYTEQELLLDVNDTLTKMALACLFEDASKYLDVALEKRSIILNNFNLILKDLYLSIGEPNYKKIYVVLSKWLNDYKVRIINDKGSVLTNEAIVNNFCEYFKEEHNR